MKFDLKYPVSKKIKVSELGIGDLFTIDGSDANMVMDNGKYVKLGYASDFQGQQTGRTSTLDNMLVRLLRPVTVVFEVVE
jgi:hypothetical protein